ncbi:MAG: hypothetical protein IJ121_00465 [Eubacterium sp.]|nr:hypothetical protein [Eubacterium sp.]
MKLTPQLLSKVFSNGSLPSLVYANRQNVSDGKRVRPMHSHQNLCELLICYHGSGIYNINQFSNAGAFLSVLPLSLYTGQRGNIFRCDQYAFYLFYPLHLILLLLIRDCLLPI